MKRTIDFGVVKWDAHRNRAKVTVEMELREDKQGRPVFSCSADVWNHLKTDIIMGGQCLDEIHLNDPLFKTIRELWRKHHLNDMHAGTPSQTLYLQTHESEHHWDYEQCKITLFNAGLLVVEHNGRPYQYGTGWLYWPIPDEDLEQIKRIIETGKL